MRDICSLLGCALLNKDVPTRRPVHTLGSIEATSAARIITTFVFDFRQGHVSVDPPEVHVRQGKHHESEHSALGEGHSTRIGDELVAKIRHLTLSC